MLTVDKSLFEEITRSPPGSYLGVRHHPRVPLLLRACTTLVISPRASSTGGQIYRTPKVQWFLAQKSIESKKGTFPPDLIVFERNGSIVEVLFAKRITFIPG